MSNKGVLKPLWYFHLNWFEKPLLVLLPFRKYCILSLSLVDWESWALGATCFYAFVSLLYTLLHPWFWILIVFVKGKASNHWLLNSNHDRTCVSAEDFEVSRWLGDKGSQSSDSGLIKMLTVPIKSLQFTPFSIPENLRLCPPVKSTQLAVTLHVK